MTKVDIFSGFLGAGKTTLIKKLIKEAYSGEKLVLIENEFGKIGIDGGFLKEAGIEITEMNSGCICCSLVGDFGEALKKVTERFSPDRILIEPSGVGKLSDVVRAVQNAGIPDLELNAMTTVIDATKCRLYLKNFEEFYRNQIEFASCIVLSRTGGIAPERRKEALSLIRQINPTVTVITTPWEEVDGKQILSAMEQKNTLEAELAHLLEEQEKEEHHHHHHHHEDGEECDDPDCECHHHDDDDEEEHHHHHHHHEDGEECDDPDCECHHHDDDDEEEEHHHHHHADEVFTSWGTETADRFSADFVKACLASLESGKYGSVLRAKGILPCTDGTWIYFDYVPGETNLRTGLPDVTGKLCVIGAGLDKKGLAALFENRA